MPEEHADPPTVGADATRLRPIKVMPWWLVLLGLVVAAGLGWLVIAWLLGEAEAGTTRAQLRIDAIRTGLTVVAGTGGAVALLLAARRQWLSERAQRHEERVAEQNRTYQDRTQEHAERIAAQSQVHDQQVARFNEHDATERRITDLYARAVDQLGSPRPAVRLGGLYALERLGQSYPAHRQTIMDVICAYLRMPADLDGQEPQVRQTAQVIIVRHLRQQTDTFWPDMRIDLAQARLTGFDASACTFASADFHDATFTGGARFDDAVFEKHLMLEGAHFGGDDTASFTRVRCARRVTADRVRFDCPVEFDGARFASSVSFVGARFAADALFRQVSFGASASFDRAVFGDHASYRKSVFERGASFEHVVFLADVGFRSTRFADMALFRWATFEGQAGFEGTAFENRAPFARAVFKGRATFEEATLHRKPRSDPPMFDAVRAASGGGHAWPPGVREAAVEDGWVTVVPA